MDTRASLAKKNIAVSIICQIVSVVCGLILPRVMLKSFGSEIYGATSSIAQFLSYIALLESGVGAVARAALYKPLAEKDSDTIGRILHEVIAYFRTIGYIFILYTVIIAVSFKSISQLECLDWLSTFFLVIIIAGSTFAQYFIGISYAILIQAGQRVYITNLTSIVGTVINTIAVVILCRAGCNILIVKLISSLIFCLRPVFLYYYARKKFPCKPKASGADKILAQKWSALGQHLAYFFNSNTDIVLLTVFANLKVVAVYSVYNMVVSQIKAFISTITSGMEAVFGDMIARSEVENLKNAVRRYANTLSMVSIPLLSITAVLIFSFVGLYTADIRDNNYYAPLFAFLLILAAGVYLASLPYSRLSIAANQIRRTRGGAYGETVINLVVSIVLVSRYDLVGVMIGTVISSAFRLIYYAGFAAKYVLETRMGSIVKRWIFDILLFAVDIGIGNILLKFFTIGSYLDWCIAAAVVSCAVILVSAAANLLLYRDDTSAAFRSLLKKPLSLVNRQK